jgi:hypothetical protein
MSVLAQNMAELRRLSVGGAGALTDHLIHATAGDIINEGVATEVFVAPPKLNPCIRLCLAVRRVFNL